MTNNIKVLIWIFSLITTSIFSQIKKTTTPSWVKKQTYSLSPKINPNELNNGSMVLMFNNQTNSITSEYYTRNVIKILESSGVQHNSSISFLYDPTYQSATVHSINIIREGERINKLDINKFQLLQREENAENHIYDGTLTAILNLEDIRKGDIIDYSYTIKGFNPIYNNYFSTNFQLDYYEPVGKMIAYLITDKKLNFKYSNPELKPIIETKNNYTSYLWETKNIKNIEFEENTPSWFNYYQNISISEFNNWKEVANWAEKVFKINQTLSPALKEKIEFIRSNFKDDGVKIKEVLKFVQNEVRYLGLESGIGSHKPFHPNKVFEQRYGDCKDKSLLMSTMLNELGIEAYPILVNSYLEHKITEKLPSSKIFNHCIVKVVSNNNEFWYDPTYTEQGGTFDNIYVPQYKYGLPVKKGSSLEKINSDIYGKTEVFEVFDIRSIYSPVTLNVTSKYYNKDADDIRYYFLNNGMTSIKKDYLNFYNKYYNSVKLSDSIIFEDDHDKNIFIVHEKYTIDSLWTPSETSNKLLEAYFYPSSIYDYIYLPNIKERKTPFYLNSSIDIKQNIKIKLPEKWAINPEKIKIDSKYFSYSFFDQYNDKQEELDLSFSFKIFDSFIPSNKFNQYVIDMQNVENKISYGININKDILENRSSNNFFNWKSIIAGFLNLICIFFLIYLAYKTYYSYDLKIDNNNNNIPIGGWLILIAISLIFTPIVFIIQIIKNNLYFTYENISSLEIINNLNYVTLVCFEIFMNFGFAIFYILGTILFFKKRTIFPRFFIILIISHIVFLLIDTLSIYFLSFDLPEYFSKKNISYTEIFKETIKATIITAYLLISKRVKNTFVNTLD
ncbi:hypothetical protein UJ101_01917 [Flavobacteriaceae bacterium UJ101]|nr:hypothetical protein UJ101_01917 [Flavobacteriaceae bacterium UJ101]